MTWRDHNSSEFESEDEGDQGGWVPPLIETGSLKCPVASHWDCLTKTQREEILKMALEIDRVVWNSSAPPSSANAPKKRLGLDASQTTYFLCNYCRKGSICMECLDMAQPLQPLSEAADSTHGEDVAMADASPQSIGNEKMTRLFRCFRCKRPAHYAHMPLPPGLLRETDIADIIARYAERWLCSDCYSFDWDIDKILAWRPLPQTAARLSKHYLPREYLVKWVGRGYVRAQWVPHMWLTCINHAKLNNFLTGGSPVGLLDEPEHPSPHVMPQSSGSGEAVWFGDTARRGAKDPIGMENS
ncbi:hypothetical protein R3P38DRAFT_3493907 [Favolaschia claudopus]|uniref:PHD/FYVE-zinc-finger like domain-containing protein n=1 Tax=Favolaschia claudopus TaxID=2862362 RepID=A0AAW0C8J7_9AGAR